MKPEFGGPTEVMDGRSSVPEGFDPNARVEVCENLQQGEADTATTDVHERTEKGDAVEAVSGPSDADVPDREQAGAEGDSVLDELFSKLEDLFDDLNGSHEVDSREWADKLYTSMQERVAFVRGTDAEFIGDGETFAIRPKLENPRGMDAYQKMRDFGVREICCVKGVVDFAPVSVAQTTINGMTSNLRGNKKLI